MEKTKKNKIDRKKVMKKLNALRKTFKYYNIDGYIVPKNDEFFGEYVNDSNDRLKFISSFTGSAGYALILRKKSYLFVDGRYTLQAFKESGEKFKIVEIYKKKPSDIIDKLRKKIWFIAPLVSSLVGSTIDTFLFFSISFYGTGVNWVSLSFGDLFVKIFVATVMLIPFRLLLSSIQENSILEKNFSV